MSFLTSHVLTCGSSGVLAFFDRCLLGKFKILLLFALFLAFNEITIFTFIGYFPFTALPLSE